MAQKPTAFKDWISPELLTRMGAALAKVEPTFDARRLRALAPRLKPLELKDRVRLIASQLEELLPRPFPKGAQTLLRSLDLGTLSGFDLWPYTEWIQSGGIAPEHHDAALDALHLLTQKFTAEFAIRPFLILAPKQTFKRLAQWTRDPSEHVRRLVSEGSRPRLPWGERLTELVRDPSPTLPLLEALHDDPSEYVRRSVANHLNDISKDHPEVVIRLLKRWSREARGKNLAELEVLTRHALRSLVKNGNADALDLLGVNGRERARIAPVRLKLSKKTVRMGETLAFSFDLRSQGAISQKLIVDYVIHHAKARGHTTPKVFKLRTLTLKPRETRMIEKNHRLKPVTVRRYHPGRHALEIQVNGRIFARAEWTLKASKSQAQK